MSRNLMVNRSPLLIASFTYEGSSSLFTMTVDENMGVRAKYKNNGDGTVTVNIYATSLDTRPTNIQFEGVSNNGYITNISYMNFATLTSLYRMFYGIKNLTSLNTAYITIKSTIDISDTNLDSNSIQSIINSLYDYSGSSISESDRTIYVGTLSITDSQKTQISNKNWVLKTTSNSILLNKISNITVTRGNTFNITYSTNITAIKHEISWDNGSTYWDKTSEITSSGTTYTYTHAADTEYDYFDMCIRVTDSNGNVSIRDFKVYFN